MEKAYDLKALGQKIKDMAAADGLTIAEESVEKLGKAVYLGTKEWAKESAVISENKFDDFAAALYDHMDVLVIPQIEKLDLDGDGK